MTAAHPALGSRCTASRPPRPISTQLRDNARSAGNVKPWLLRQLAGDVDGYPPPPRQQRGHRRAPWQRV